MLYCFVYQNLRRLKKPTSFRVQSGSLRTAALPYQTSTYFIPRVEHETSYRTPSCINSAMWVRVLESCEKNLTYMDGMSYFKGSKIYYVYYGAKNQCCCVWTIISVKDRKTKPHLFNILDNYRDVKLSVNVLFVPYGGRKT